MVSTSSSELATEGDEPTGFFSLPRELRDTIYGMVWQEHKHKVNAAYYIVNAAIPNVRLISRQFRSEYDESSPADSFATVYDMYGPSNNFRGFPRLATHSTRLELIWEVCSARFFPAHGSQFSSHYYLLCVKDRLIALMCLLCRTPSIKDVHIHLRMNTVFCVRSVDIHLYIHTNDHLGRMVDELIACPILADSITESLNSWGSTVTAPQYLAGWSGEHGFAVSNAEERKAMLKMEAARGKKTKNETESVLDEDLESSCGKDGDGEDESGAATEGSKRTSLLGYS
jgi:hypothetical protein